MKPIIDKKWQLRPVSDEGMADLRAAGYTPLMSRLLAGRGMTTEVAAAAFLQGRLADLPDPELLLGMTAAVQRLVQAVEAGERICIYGDYDVDGVTATALLVRFFRTVGADVRYHIPHRIDDGYGLSREGLAAVVAAGARVVISVDCGISAVAEAAFCREIGLDLIITDHHLPGAVLPDAVAVLNPQQPGCPFPHKSLAGVGVAFYLAIALRTRLRESGFFISHQEPDLRLLLDLVALGTIADMVPLRETNRVLVRAGLAELSRSERPGIAALMRVAGVTGPVSCGMVGFRLAPRINAAGRLEDATKGVELLLTDDSQLAARLAGELDEANRARQELEREILAEAITLARNLPAAAKRRSIVLASADWHPGVIGIVASRIVELYHRPTILIALQEGMGKGSGRSIPALHLKDALDACADHLLKFGGHRQAAGLSVREETLAAFVERFEEISAGLLADDDLVPLLQLDAELTAAEATQELVADLQQLAPFGIGNPEPVFLLRAATVQSVRQLNGGHLRLAVTCGGRSLEALLFAPAERQVVAGEVLDLAGALQLNSWQGKNSVQLRVKDLRPTGGEVFDAA